MLLAHLVAAATTILTLAGLGYYIFALWAARAYNRTRRKPQLSIYPPVSLLKPVKGMDPGMYQDFASHCRQDYPGEYEIIFGVRRLEDESVPVIRRLQTEFPDRRIHLAICPEKLGSNGKVSNLVQMLPQVRFDHLIVNDSDIRVSPRYLRNVMGQFSSREGGRPVGMVTALYRGRSHQTLGSRLEALGIATDFMAGVLMARWLEKGIRFGMGSTLAFTRKALDAIGGLQPLVDYLGDDYELGARISKAGFRVKLSCEVVETSVPAYRFHQFFDHQLRWARNLRDARKAGYWGMLVTFGLPWALLNTLTNGGSLSSLALLSLMLLARIALALSVGVGVLEDRRVLRDLWLLPLRDCVALVIWVWSFADDHVEWRGERFLLSRGKLTRQS
ncbi:MAG TPA: bacteriohopanetetrol glucosamine biosynthesis glycosyltransferase HpnI [Acidobacteriaceae bacterium]|jgi:ceramide glucosyltransferase|nr:bacteriohopanetetrol glucosamine biosynthesis glycosyltransferase HpnI [Acidobacteriaceae bacterium]